MKKGFEFTFPLVPRISMSSFTLTPRSRFTVTARPPDALSISNRALLIAALAEGETVFDCQCQRREMLTVMQQLGVRIDIDEPGRRMTVFGCGGIFPEKSAEIVLRQCDATARFLTAALAFTDGDYRIAGAGRLAHLSMADLLFPLGQLGTEVISERGNDNLPLHIIGVRGKEGTVESLARYGMTADRSGRGGRFAVVSGHITSQYLSALLLAAPVGAQNGNVELHVVNELVDRPFVRMTLAMMKRFGIDLQSSIGTTHVLLSKGITFTVPQGSVYQGQRLTIEPEALGANCLFAGAALLGGEATVEGISENSLQGDIDFIYCLRRMGCTVTFEQAAENGASRDSVTVRRDPDVPLRGINVDMNELADSVPLLATLACFAENPTKISNVGYLRLRDGDRLALLVGELRKLGAHIDELPDGLTIHPGSELHGAELESHDDHRLAMGLAIAGLAVPGVTIHGAEAAALVWPEYFEFLEGLATPS